jgi:hypothetical protein
VANSFRPSFTQGSLSEECGSGVHFDWDKYKNIVYLVNGCGWQRDFAYATMQYRYAHKDVDGTHTLDEAIVIQASLDALKGDL